VTTHWPWWIGALALTAFPLLHWLLLRRGLAVSGRFSALVDRLRFGPDDVGEGELDQAALLEALRAQTLEAFGEEALEEEADEAPFEGPEIVPMRGPQRVADHVLFLGGLALGGFVSAAIAGSFELVAGLRGEDFGALAEALPVPTPLLLLVGGACVGFGTRMAAGCTSGHGLCGVSRLQPGSLLATAAFFSAGVATSLLLGAWL